MSTDVVIRAEGLGKKYMIGRAAERERYVALRDVLARRARNLQRSAIDILLGRPIVAGDEVEAFWALKEINFEIQRGEVIGVIGRNGAGKSTLLKILSRITEPSTGKVTIKGRVASLLEVGTGFHPELTGRENIFLNGAILGMLHSEIKHKFDEIVAFAEVERFLDTPVKRYSSGMYVRLAFAVAAHLEPEILIVDEVLAVGDAAFQEKCLGKMSQVATREGRTVLFVSHNMSAISQLCAKTALLQSGHLIEFGPTATALSTYLTNVQKGNDISLFDWTDRITTHEVKITRLEFGNNDQSPFYFGRDFRFRIHATVRDTLTDPTFGLIIHDALGVPITNIQSIHSGLRTGRIAGDVIVEGLIPAFVLYPGKYFLSPWVMDSSCRHDLDFLKMCAEVEITASSGIHGDLKLDPDWGKVFLPSRWKLRSAGDSFAND